MLIETTQIYAAEGDQSCCYRLPLAYNIYLQVHACAHKLRNVGQQKGALHVTLGEVD